MWPIGIFFSFIWQIFVFSWIISHLTLESRRKTLKRSRKVFTTIRIAFGLAVSLSLGILVLQSSHEYDSLSFLLPLILFFFSFYFFDFLLHRPVELSNSPILALNIRPPNTAVHKCKTNIEEVKKRKWEESTEKIGYFHNSY